MNVLQIVHHRFGICEPYKGGIDVCDSVFTKDVDYVFIASTHGSQKNISTFLEQNVPSALILKNGGNFCLDHLHRIICNYYLSPCGAEIPPYSICPQECSAVQMECPVSWESAKLGLKDYYFISCDETSAFLFPLPNCCTGVGINVIKPEEGIWIIM